MRKTKKRQTPTCLPKPGRRQAIRFLASLLVNTKYDSPLDEVVSSTLLGSPDFIAFIKDNLLSGKKSDKELPALKDLVPKVSMQDIFNEVEYVFREEKALSRNVKMYLCRKHTGEKLKDISINFGIGEAGAFCNKPHAQD